MSQVQESALRETWSWVPALRWGLKSGRPQCRPHFPLHAIQLQAEAVCSRPSPDALKWDELGPTGDDYNQEEVVAEVRLTPPLPGCPRPHIYALVPTFLLCCCPIQPTPSLTFL